MKQLEDKIAEINQAISLGLGSLVCDLKGLSYEVKTEKEKGRVEAGTEYDVSLNSDSDLTAYHVHDGEIDFDRYQNRGKKKMYFPRAPLALLCMVHVKKRHLEDSILSILQSISYVTIKGSSPDKYSIWRDETGKEDMNFDYHVFKINYDFSFKTADCRPYCK